MLHRYILISILSAGLPAYAADSQGAFEHCRGHAQVARQIMELRQSGEEMESMMQAASEMKEYRRGTEALIRMAFDVPLMRTDESKKREISEFSNSVLSSCMDAKDPR